MSKQITKHNSSFKLRLVTKYLSEKLTVSQICSEFNVSKATVHKWVKQFKDNSSLIFNQSNVTSKKDQKEYKFLEKKIDNLYTKIGKLTCERDFLKKVLDT